MLDRLISCALGSIVLAHDTQCCDIWIQNSLFPISDTNVQLKYADKFDKLIIARYDPTLETMLGLHYFRVRSLMITMDQDQEPNLLYTCHEQPFALRAT